MNIDTKNRLYLNGDEVYFGYNRLNVHNQKGRLFIKHKGRQINIKNIPHLPKEEYDDENDPVFDYVFGGGFVNFPCVAMDYWIERYRMNRIISINDFKSKHLNKQS